LSAPLCVWVKPSRQTSTQKFPDVHGSGWVGFIAQNVFKIYNLYVLFNRPANSLSVHDNTVFSTIFT